MAASCSRGVAQNRVRDVDAQTIDSGGVEGLVEPIPCFPNERLAFNHFPLARRLSYDDPVRHGWAVSGHEGPVLQRAVIAASERCFGLHTEILGIQTAGIDPPLVELDCRIGP